MKKRQIIIVAIGLFIVVGSMAAMSLLSSQREEPIKEKPVVAKKYVKTEPVEYTNISTEIVAYGRVSASENLDLISEQSGRMYQVDVWLKEGQKFKKGDLLFRVDNREAALKLHSQKSNFIKDLASIAPDIKVDFPERYNAWYDYYRSIKLDQSLKNLPSNMTEKERTFLATKNILSSYYDIKSQETNLAKFNYYAPFNGSITEISMQSGSFVNPGAKIGHIIRSDKLELKVDIPIDEIHWVKLGSRVTIDTEDGEKGWDGYVSRISEILNKNTQSIDVYIEIQGNKNTLYDGQYLRSTIPGRDVLGAMEIARNVIVENSFVYIVQDTLLKKRLIAIHKINAETVIFNGIAEGADLVIEPLINASNNMKVFKLGEKETVTDLQDSEDDSITSAVAKN